MDQIKIIIYQTKMGKCPFIDWRDKLDRQARAIIRTRLDRVSLGNFGDSKFIKNGEGVRELRIDYGPGYRVYFGKKDDTIVILLMGGDKSSQESDIAKAKRFWLEYKKDES